MSEFPLAPHLSKILLTAADMGCSDEVLTIVSMLSVKYVFIRPSAKFKRKQMVRLLVLVDFPHKTTLILHGIVTTTGG